MPSGPDGTPTFGKCDSLMAIPSCGGKSEGRKCAGHVRFFSSLHYEYECGVSPSSNTDCTLRTLRIIGAATFAAGAAGATTVSGVAAVVVTVVVVPDAHADVTVVVIVGMVKRGVCARTFFVRTLKLCLSQVAKMRLFRHWRMLAKSRL